MLTGWQCLLLSKVEIKHHDSLAFGVPQWHCDVVILIHAHGDDLRAVYALEEIISKTEDRTRDNVIYPFAFAGGEGVCVLG